MLPPQYGSNRAFACLVRERGSETDFAKIVINNKWIRAFIHTQASAFVTASEDVRGNRIADGFFDGVVHETSTKLRMKSLANQEG